MGELERRIKFAEDSLSTYPKWVRDNNYFAGGEMLRTEEQAASLRAAIIKDRKANKIFSGD